MWLSQDDNPDSPAPEVYFHSCAAQPASREQAVCLGKANSQRRQLGLVTGGRRTLPGEEKSIPNRKMVQTKLQRTLTHRPSKLFWWLAGVKYVLVRKEARDTGSGLFREHLPCHTKKSWLNVG